MPHDITTGTTELTVTIAPVSRDSHSGNDSRFPFFAPGLGYRSSHNGLMVVLREMKVAVRIPIRCLVDLRGISSSEGIMVRAPSGSKPLIMAWIYSVYSCPRPPPSKM